MVVELVRVDVRVRRTFGDAQVCEIYGLRAGQAFLAEPGRVVTVAALVDDHVVAEAAGVVPMLVDRE